MSGVLGVILAALVVVLALWLFASVDAVRLARMLRLIGPAMLGLVGVVLLLLGRAGIGGMMLSGAAAWYAASSRMAKAKPSPGRRSVVRTAALEMELDHDSGGLEGHVLAGTREGRVLSTLDLTELLSLRRELASDSESIRLLDTYLDGRFPVWRDDAQALVGAGVGSSPASGPMSKEEAYKILGLEAGASAAAIREAHRRLMQRLHPDLGGTTFLAARINEAKDVLLSHHD
jgi:hypothetical protein